MSILAWIEDQKRLKVLNAPKYVNSDSDSSKGLWTRCDKCGVILYVKHLKENQRVCFGCSYHLQMSSKERIENLIDKGSWNAFDETVSPCDPLQFHDQKKYTDRVQVAQEKTGLQDAIQTGTGMVDQIPVALAVMDFDFMGGSMGSVVGEKLTRLIEYATQEGLTLLIVSASGGARMQEGVFSLMQMAKISSALQVYQSCANLLYISIITSPTTGGVTASFAMLGDIIFAEPNALIAFAGRRVIEQTLREDLPDDFQTSEYMLHHGLVDLIVPRRFLKQALSETIRLYQNAPFKRVGRIPFGVQNPINFVTEEKIRREWDDFTISQKIKNQYVDASKVSSNTLFDARPLEGVETTTESTSESTWQKSAVSSSIEITPSISRAQNRNRGGVGFNSRTSRADLDFQGGFDDAESLHVDHRQNVWDQIRQSIEYRDVLTSFEIIFQLFSKEMYVCRDFNAIAHPPGEKLHVLDVAPHEKTRVQNERGTALKKESTTEKSRYSSRKREQVNEKQAFQTSWIPSFFKSTQPGVDLSEIGLPNREAENQSNVNFFNQAIEMAASESVEWRAFYIDQQISKTTGFLEDFLQPAFEANSDTSQQNLQRKVGNLLFYRSICQSSTIASVQR